MLLREGPSERQVRPSSAAQGPTILPSIFKVTFAASSWIVILSTQSYVAIEDPKCAETQAPGYVEQNKMVSVYDEDFTGNGSRPVTM